MKIIIDVDSAGHPHFIDTVNGPGAPLAHPTLPGQFVTIMQFLPLLSATPALRTTGGWNVTNQLPGELVATTRWQRMLNAIALLPASDPLRLLSLQP